MQQNQSTEITIHKGRNLAQAMQGNELSKTSDLLSILTGDSPRIADATVQELDQLFGKIFRLIGLREVNFPNDLETLFLYQFVRENYPNHRIDEVFLAFKKAVLLQLDLSANEVKCYENFSVLYLSSILNAYRRWASAEFSNVEKHLPPTDAERKLLEKSKTDFENFHWGEAIEIAYQDFLVSGRKNQKIVPTGMYEQLVSDGVFSADFFSNFIEKTKRELISEAIREKQKRINTIDQISVTMQGEKMETEKSIQQTKIGELQKAINRYNSETPNHEVEVSAKQEAIFSWFEKCQSRGLKNVYVAEKDKK